MKRKKGVLLFVTSWLPGCGQMYQGYMKRGMSLMLGCCTLFVVAMMLRLDMLMIFMLPIWLYAFFDSYNLHNLREQDLAPADDWLFGLSAMDRQKLSALCRGRHSLIGWGLVLAGLYTLFETVVTRLMRTFYQQTDLWWVYDAVVNYLPRLAITIGIIALGIWFIRGPKVPKQEEIPPFTPPAEDPASAAAETPATEQEDDHGQS